ncbi:MAG TPA: YtxH domain-containing protein [Chloroflexota bacterium]
MARQDSGGFLAGLVVGGLVGAALALLSTPRGGRLARGAMGGLGVDSPEDVLERGRDALRARFRHAAAEAQAAANETEQRLEAEYHAGRDGS